MKEMTLENTVGMPLIESAGGLVYNKEYHILLMFKRGKWDLPKGRLDGSPDIQGTAIREVNEETGLKLDRLSVTGCLPPTWHTTSHGKQNYLKKTHWFMMEYDGSDDDVIPQVEEGIIECRWVHLSKLDKYMKLLRRRVHYVVDFWHKNLVYVPRT